MRPPFQTYQASFVPVEVELPDVCPHCDKVFQGPSDLACDDIAARTHRVQVNSRGEPELDAVGGDVLGLTYTDEWRCGGCLEILPVKPLATPDLAVGVQSQPSWDTRRTTGWLVAPLRWWTGWKFRRAVLADYLHFNNATQVARVEAFNRAARYHTDDELAVVVEQVRLELYG